RQLVNTRITCEYARIGVGDFTKDVEVGNTAQSCAFEHGRHESLPELRVDMPRRVHAETVDRILLDPRAVDLDHTLPHLRVLGHQIVETRKVAEQRALAAEGAVASIVVVDRVV